MAPSEAIEDECKDRLPLSRPLRTIQFVSGRQAGNDTDPDLPVEALFSPTLWAMKQCSLSNGIIYHLQAAILRQQVQWEESHCQEKVLTCLKVLPLLRRMVIMSDRSHCTDYLKLASLDDGNYYYSKTFQLRSLFILSFTSPNCNCH